jgi:hypothetical protein
MCQAPKIRHPPDLRTELWPTTLRKAITGTATGSISTKIRTPILDKGAGSDPEKLKRAVEKVGVMVTEVRKALGKPGVVVEA